MRESSPRSCRHMNSGPRLKLEGCEVKEAERLDAPSPLPPPESFMYALDPIYPSFPTYRLLDETMRGELRVLLACKAQRRGEEDMPAGRTVKSPLGARTALWPTGA